MKKLIIIAAASFFTFTSCSKVETIAAPQSNSISIPNAKPSFPSGPQRCTITNTETTSDGGVQYWLTYTDQNNVVHTLFVNMGQSITICLSNALITTNFTYTIVTIGNC